MAEAAAVAEAAEVAEASEAAEVAEAAEASEASEAARRRRRWTDTHADRSQATVPVFTLSSPPPHTHLPDQARSDLPRRAPAPRRS